MSGLAEGKKFLPETGAGAKSPLAVDKFCGGSHYLGARYGTLMSEEGTIERVNVTGSLWLAS